MTTKLCAAAMALLGFSTSMFIGLWVDNPFITVVMRSLGVLILFYILGYFLAGIGQKVVEENFNNEIWDDRRNYYCTRWLKKSP